MKQLKNVLPTRIQLYIEQLNKENITAVFHSKFVRNVFAVASGTAMAQLITMLFSPVLTRLYGPEAFGVLGVFTSMMAVVIPIVALAYPIAIVLPKEELVAEGLVRLSLYISVFVSVLVAVVLLFFGQFIVEVLQVQVLAPYLLLIPVMMIFSAGVQVAQQWLIRKKQFKVKAKVAVAQNFIVNTLTSGFGLLYPSATTLILITTLGQGIHTLILAKAGGIASYMKSFYRSPAEERADTPLRTVAKKYSDFPIYRAPQVFINAVSQSLPVLMLTTFFGPASAGFYSIGRKVLGMPSQLIANSVGDVFYPRIAEATHKGENITRLLVKATLTLALVGLVPFGVIIYFGPSLFSFVFGVDWATAGVYARWIGLWSYFMFINRPAVKTLPVIEAQQFHLAFSVVTILARVIALGVGGYVFGSDVVAVALYGISGSILNAMLIVLTIIKSKSYHNERRAK